MTQPDKEQQAPETIWAYGFLPTTEGVNCNARSVRPDWLRPEKPPLEYILKAKHDAEIAELQTRIAELEARSVVKPLEWDEDRPAKCWLAETGWGYYSVYFNSEYGWLCELDGHDDSWVKYPEEEYGFPFAEAAKTAAQADYERRILSALEVSDGA